MFMLTTDKKYPSIFSSLVVLSWILELLINVVYGLIKLLFAISMAPLHSHYEHYAKFQKACMLSN